MNQYIRDNCLTEYIRVRESIHIKNIAMMDNGRMGVRMVLALK
jgi:hypothetical protein